jgi:hypothetical protein
MKRKSKRTEKENDENKEKRKTNSLSQKALNESVLRIKELDNNSKTADSEWYA